jgi:hypothetical protein
MASGKKPYFVEIFLDKHDKVSPTDKKAGMIVITSL